MNDSYKDRWLDQLPLLTDVYQEDIDLGQPFEQVAARFAEDRGTVLLQSGSSLDCAQYHILALDPWLEVIAGQHGVNIIYGGQTVALGSQDIFHVIQQLLDRYKIKGSEIDLPVSCGLFGYFSYDLKDAIERLPRTCVGDGLPDLYLVAPSLVLVQDKRTEKTTLNILSCNGSNYSGPGAENGDKPIKDLLFEKLDTPVKQGGFCVDQAGFESSFTKDEYIDAVNRIIAYLRAGDIYQANLSQRFEAGFSGDPFSLFLDLYQRNPASFFAFVNAGDHQIVSTSPERFIKQRSEHVETRPIKGTIARGKTEDEDKKNSHLLSNSLKDDAELTMIVDLMRNDLSRVTKHGSVIVTEHKRLEPYENVFHLVSVVQGELLPGKTSVDLIRATFPGGSITGCPKIRSMEIIDALEPVKRHVYTGSIGYVSFHDTMDLSIAIRTATIFKGRVCFSVGGGIVYDSDPEKEFQETLDKGKTLMESLSGQQTVSRSPQAKVWLNGKICHPKDALVSAAGTGFQYGAGLFETIRVDHGRVFYLDEHVRRMTQAWEQLFDQPVPDVCWEDVIRVLIRENGVDGRTLAVKLMMALDEPRKPILAAFVREYVHRLTTLDKPGLDLVTYPHPRHTFLADHKTMNYLFYEQARRFALKAKADEALILNADSTVSETNTANIISVRGRHVVVPQSDHMLRGITLEKSLQIFEANDYTVEYKKVSDTDIKHLPNVLLTNSLMGAVKVLHIDGIKIEHDQDICSFINGHGPI